MKQWIGASVLALAVTGCSHMETVDEKYTATDPAFQKSFSRSAHDCVTASTKTLDEMGAGIEQSSGNDIVSKRYDVYQFAVVSAMGNGAVATGTSQINRQTAKIYLRVQPEGSGCKVNVARVRAWNNGTEFEKIDVGFTHRHIVTPFFKELSERLIK